MFESFDEPDEDISRHARPGNFVMNLLVDKLTPKPEVSDPLSFAARRRAESHIYFEKMQHREVFRSWLTEMLRHGAPDAEIINVKKQGILGVKHITAAGWLLYSERIIEGRSYGEWGYKFIPFHLLANGKWAQDGYLLKDLPAGYKRALGPMTDIAVTHGLSWRPPSSRLSK